MFGGGPGGCGLGTSGFRSAGVDNVALVLERKMMEPAAVVLVLIKWGQCQSRRRGDGHLCYCCCSMHCVLTFTGLHWSH